MKRRDFLQSLLFLVASPALERVNPLDYMKKTNAVRLLRHATLVLQVGGVKFLIDPMLSKKDELDPVQNCGNDIRIPMVDLPVDNEELERIISDVDAVVVTHLHRDHWDAAAQVLIGKRKPLICQPSDADKLRAQGFVDLHPVVNQITWKGVTISRTGGQHGTGEIGQKMGAVSGFVFRDKSQTIYVAGDTIWCDEVAQALTTYQPQVTIVNAGGAQFLSGGPITMTPDDILEVHAHLPQTKIIAVHMDTVNHCFVRRSDLQKIVTEKGLQSKVLIPADGERMAL